MTLKEITKASPDIHLLDTPVMPILFETVVLKSALSEW